MNKRLFMGERGKVFSGFLTVVILMLMLQVKAQTKPWPVPPQAQELKNPFPVSTANVEEGKSLYKLNCVPCHGDKGKGDGPASAALSPKPADHTSAMMLKETDGSLFYKISEGHTPMPAYKAALTEKQRWELVDYVRTLRKAGKK